MKKINIALLIMMMSCLLIQAAQESKSDNDSDVESIQNFKRRRLHSDLGEQSILTISALPAGRIVDEERQDFINSIVENFNVLDQGLNLLRKQGKKIERLDRFMDNKLELDTDDQDSEINQNRVDFGMMIEQAQDLLMTEMRDPFLKALNKVIISSDNDIKEQIDRSNDPILRYVMRYKNEKLEPMVKQWVNHQDEFGATLLYKSAVDDDLEAVEFLLSLGADANIQNENGRTPLHEAVCFQDVEMMEILFQAGANLDIQDIHGETAMYEAFMHDDMLTVQLLYNWGANPNIINDNGDFYYQDSMTEIREDYCNRNFDVLSAAYLKKWELRRAIINYDVDRAKILIAQADDGDFLPSQAYIQNLLRERNLNLSVLNGDIFGGETNLQIACMYKDNLEIAKLLLKFGARPNKRSHYTHETALDYATDCLSIEHVRLLIEYGADVNLIDGNGETALSFALKNQNDSDEAIPNPAEVKKEIIKLLLQAGAQESLNIANGDDVTPLMMVVDDNNIELLRMFLEYSPDVNFIASNDNGDNNNDGNSLLHIACRRNHIDIARLLLAQPGIDTSIVNDDDQTALDLATTDEMRALFV